MKSRLLVIALGLAVAAPGHACSIIWTPFVTHVRNADLAIRATPKIEFSVFTDERWAGTVTLGNIHCLKKPRGEQCPKTLTVQFDDRFDGASCPSALEGSAPGKQSRLRYFILDRRRDGDWRISLAEERYR